MTLLQEINITQNKKLVFLLNVLAVVLLIPFFNVFAMLGHLVTGQSDVAESFTNWQMFGLLLVTFLIMGIHELVHGLFFKVFNPKGKVRYGFKWIFAYAASPGNLYHRHQMLVIGLAPFVLISFVLTLLLAFGVISVLTYVLLATIHAAGCIGDFYYVYLLLIKHGKGKILVEDTETGLLIYAA